MDNDVNLDMIQTNYMIDDIRDDMDLITIKHKHIELARKHQEIVKKFIQESKHCAVLKKKIDAHRREIVLKVKEEQSRLKDKKDRFTTADEKNCEVEKRVVTVIGEEVYDKLETHKYRKTMWETLMKSASFTADRMHDALIADSSVKKYLKPQHMMRDNQ